jgi:hypothetical protein
VRREALVGFDEARLLLFVACAQRRLVGRRRRRQRVAVDLDVFDGHPLRRAVLVRMRGVPVLDLLATDRRGVGHGRRQHRDRDVAGLAEQAQEPVEFARRHERRLRDLRGNQRLLQAVAHLLFELARGAGGHAGLQRQLVALGIEASLDLELRDRLDLLAHLRIADGDAGIARREARGGLVDQHVEHAALVLDRFERARIECLALLRALLLADLLELGAERLGRHFLRLPHRLAHDPQVGRRSPPRWWRLDLGRVVGRVLEQVLLHAEERERDREDDDDHHGDPAGGLFSEGLQHGMAAPGT